MHGMAVYKANIFHIARYRKYNSRAMSNIYLITSLIKKPTRFSDAAGFLARIYCSDEELLCFPSNVLQSVASCVAGLIYHLTMVAAEFRESLCSMLARQESPWHRSVSVFYSAKGR